MKRIKRLKVNAGMGYSPGYLALLVIAFNSFFIQLKGQSWHCYVKPRGGIVGDIVYMNAYGQLESSYTPSKSGILEYEASSEELIQVKETIAQWIRKSLKPNHFLRSLDFRCKAFVDRMPLEIIGKREFVYCSAGFRVDTLVLEIEELGVEVTSVSKRIFKYAEDLKPDSVELMFRMMKNGSGDGVICRFEIYNSAIYYAIQQCYLSAKKRNAEHEYAFTPIYEKRFRREKSNDTRKDSIELNFLDSTKVVNFGKLIFEERMVHKESTGTFHFVLNTALMSGVNHLVRSDNAWRSSLFCLKSPYDGAEKYFEFSISCKARRKRDYFLGVYTVYVKECYLNFL